MNVRASKPEEAAWLVERVGCAITPAFRGIVAVDATGRIRGMVGYDCWTRNSAQCHMAVDTSLAWRHLLPHVFEYPFLEVGLGVLIGVVRGSNARSLRMCVRLGFAETGRIQDGWSVGEDLVMMTLRREACRFLRPYTRKEAA